MNDELGMGRNEVVVEVERVTLRLIFVSTRTQNYGPESKPNKGKGRPGSGLMPRFTCCLLINENLACFHNKPASQLNLYSLMGFRGIYS